VAVSLPNFRCQILQVFPLDLRHRGRQRNLSRHQQTTPAALQRSRRPSNEAPAAAPAEGVIAAADALPTAVREGETAERGMLPNGSAGGLQKNSQEEKEGWSWTDDDALDPQPFVLTQ